MGTPAELTEEGDPALASPVVGRTTYRIVREALTNVRKHAPGARVTVHVSYGDAQVRLAVRNAPAAARWIFPAWLGPAPAWGSPTCGSGSSWCTARCGRARAGRRVSAWRPHCPPTCPRPTGRMTMIQVVVVDDEPMVCAHLRTILTSGGTVEVVAEAHDGAAGVEAVTRTRPDVVLMDLRMPGMDGLTAIEHIGRLTAAPAVVVLTAFDADQYVLRALRAGAAGYLGQVHPAGGPHRAGPGGRGGAHGAVPCGRAAADRCLRPTAGWSATGLASWPRR